MAVIDPTTGQILRSRINEIEAQNPLDPRLSRGGGNIDVSASARTQGVVSASAPVQRAMNVAQPTIEDALSQRIAGDNSVPVDPMVAEIQQTNKALTDQNRILTEAGSQYKNEKLALAGAQFAVSVLNANAAYRQAQGTAQFNIQMARNQAKDSIFRGRQAASQAQSQGRAMSDQAILAMAAQGQDVSGAGVQRIAGSYEAMAEQNAMQLEINGIKEALGFELEEVNYNFQVRNAEINRDMTILSSALNLGAQAYGVM